MTNPSEWLLLLFLAGGEATVVPMGALSCDEIADRVRSGVPVEVVTRDGVREAITWAVCIPPRNEECDE